MIDYSSMPNHKIACIDMKSFYASCAAVKLGINVLEHPIVVIGNLEQKNSVVLAASPLAKKEFRIKTGTRRLEIPSHPDIILVEPSMQFFVNVSMEIARLLNQYVPKEAIFVYSIDECFFDLTGSERLWGPVENTIKRIQDELLQQFQLPSATGLGPSILLSKLALDISAKKTGFAEWKYEDIPNKLWPVYPLSKMWGIGERTERSLNNMGIFTVGDLANADLARLENKFGVKMGNQLYYHSHGIDYSSIYEPIKEEQISYGKSQMLMRDYTTRESVLIVVKETIDIVARRARTAGKAGRTIHLGIGYSRHALGGGFSRSMTIPEATNDTKDIYAAAVELFDKHYDHRPVRHISFSLTNLEEESSMQLSFFDHQKWKRRKLNAAMDDICEKYGPTAVVRAVSLTSHGTTIKRASLIGGHRK